MSTRDEFKSTDLFTGSDSVSQQCRTLDWASTPLGPPETWPETLASFAQLVLDSRLPMSLAWGDELAHIYNEAYIPILGDKHPEALGKPFQDVYPEVWDQTEPMLRSVLETGQPVWFESRRFFIERRGFDEETYFTNSFSPVRDEESEVHGVLACSLETTEYVLARRRAETLTELAAPSPHTSIAEVLEHALEAQGTAVDLPICLLYEFGLTTDEPLLVASHGQHDLAKELDKRIARHIPDSCGGDSDGSLHEFPADLTEGLDLESVSPPLSALVWLPICVHERGSTSRVAGLAVGVNATLPFDESYRAFLDAVRVRLSEKARAARRREIRLSNAERRYAAVFENSLDAMLLTSPTGEIHHANRAACELLGYSPEEFRELGRTGVMDTDDDRLEAAVAIRAATGEFRGELNCVHKDGRIIPCDLSSRVYRDAEGHERTVIVMRDLRDRISLEASLRQAQKLEVVGKLAGGIAHDFNNLVMAIDASAGFLEDEADLSEENAEDVRVIRSACGRAAALTRRLLAFSRQRPVRASYLELTEVVEEVETIIRSLLSEDIDVVTHIECELPTVYAARQDIEQIVLNLAVNAREAMVSGGTLSIDVENISLREPYQGMVGDVLEPGSYIRLAVSDTGEGIDTENVSRLFEPFFTTKEHGTGLGLATVADIVEQCGGGLSVESDPGRRTTFEVLLPVSEPPPLTQMSEPAHEPPREQLEGRILLIEDQPLVRRVTARMLNESGLEVTEATCGEVAIETVQQRGVGAFDLVVSDVVMPQMSGQETARRLREIDPDLEFLFISGYTDGSGLRFSSGDEAHLVSKPFTHQQLLDAIRRFLD